MVYFKKPKAFSPKFEAVSCYLQNSGKILLLKRQSHKSQGGKWGTPAGKIEKDETPIVAIKREVFEETGVNLQEGETQHIDKLYVRFPEYDFDWHMFKADVSDRSTKIKTDEHSAHLWVTPQEALKMDLVMDEDFCIRNAFKL